MKRYASIDIGTNTVRLLIADEDYLSSKRPILKSTIITRLGGGFGPSNNLDLGSMERTAKTLKEFGRLLENNKVKTVRAAATCVVRQAKNRDDFLRKVRDECGIQVEVIDAEKEARLTLKGVLSTLKGTAPPILVFDIGGGSTEYILASNGEPVVTSLDLGVVYLAEYFLKFDPPASHELALLENRIAAVLEPCKHDYLSRLSLPLTVIGCGGTVTTLAAMDRGMENYDPDQINNYHLTGATIAAIYRKLAGLPLEQRKKIAGLEPGRADVIIPGCAIVLKTLEAFRAPELVVSDAGLLEGLLLNLIKEEQERFLLKN